MNKHLILPTPKEDRINELFSYELEVFELGQGLTPGYWVAIIFEWGWEHKTFQSGGPSKLRRLFLEGVEVLHERLIGTDVTGVFGETTVHAAMVRRIGFELINGENEEDGFSFGRYAYLPLDTFLQKPWKSRL